MTKGSKHDGKENSFEEIKELKKTIKILREAVRNHDDLVLENTKLKAKNDSLDKAVQIKIYWQGKCKELEDQIERMAIEINKPISEICDIYFDRLTHCIYDGKCIEHIKKYFEKKFKEDFELNEECKECINKGNNNDCLWKSFMPQRKKEN